MEKYPFYDIVLFIAILSNVLFMSIAIIIIRTKKTSRKNSQILHKVMQLPVDEEKERSYTIFRRNGIVFLTESSKSPAEIAKSNKSGCGLAIIQSGGKGYGEKSF
ncbi:MAG: hypothetical protein ACLU3F_14290 [Blautia wexlerae]